MKLSLALLLAISCPAADVLKEMARDHVRPVELSGGKLLLSHPSASARVHQAGGNRTIETDLWRFEANPAAGRFSVLNRATGAEWRANHGAALRIEAAALTPEILRVSLHASADLLLNFNARGPFFGFGEHFMKARLDGIKTTLASEDHWSRPGHNWTYIPVPLLLVPHGIGMYVDTARASTWDLTHAGDSRFSLQLTEPTVDCYFFFARDVKGIVTSYTQLTGRPSVAPPWTFGVWLTALEGRQKVYAVADRIRKEKIPASAIWTYDQLDPSTNTGWPYWTAGYYGSLPEFTDHLHRQGFKVLTYTNAWLWSKLVPYDLANPFYDEARQKAFFALAGSDGTAGMTIDGVRTGYIDLTNRDAVAWWSRMLQKSVAQNGFDGWMEDFGEGAWTKDARFKMAGKNAELAILYPLLYHRAANEAVNAVTGDSQRAGDIVRFARSGAPGSQAFTPMVWGGDQIPEWSADHGIPSVIPAGTSIGLCGFTLWAPDIVSWGTSKEMWIRWMEYGALTPVMRDHLAQKPQKAVDLWYDAQTTDLFRRYARLHISLFPYFYTYEHEAAETGWPLIRHLILDSPEDPQAWDADQEYLLGDNILVAPVTDQGATARSLYLPKGTWVDYWTGKALNGGRQVRVDAPLDRIPILIRAGSVIPMIDPGTQTLARPLESRLTWRVFPGGHGSFRMYDHTVATADQSAAETRITVSGGTSPRQYDVILPAEKSPRNVSTGDQKPVWKMENGLLHATFAATNFDMRVRW